MPSKSQMALALRLRSESGSNEDGKSDFVRLWVNLIEETTSVLFGEDTCTM